MCLIYKLTPVNLFFLNEKKQKNKKKTPEKKTKKQKNALYRISLDGAS